MDSCDRIEILWSGGVTEGIYADHRDGGRVIVDVPNQGPTLMLASEFGKSRSVRGGGGKDWGTPLDLEWERLHAAGEVDNTAIETDTIDEDPRSVEDRAKSPIGGAISESQAALRAGVEAAGGRALTIVTIVHADGVTPSGGLEVYTDENGGPQTPEDVLAFALQGVSELAKRYGLPMAVFEA